MSAHAATLSCSTLSLFSASEVDVACLLVGLGFVNVVSLTLLVFGVCNSYNHRHDCCHSPRCYG